MHRQPCEAARPHARPKNPQNDHGFAGQVWRNLAWAGPYAPFIAMFAVGLVLLSLSRIGLMLWQIDRVAATGAWPEMLVQGVRVDVIQLGLLALPPLLLAPLLANRFGWRVWRGLSTVWVIASVTLLVFMEAVTPGFIAEYDVRPNRLFIEYLKYPREVFTMLWLGFRLHVIFGLGFLALAIWGMTRLMRPWRAQPCDWPYPRVLLAWPLVVVLVFLGIRSTTDHRPANPALFAITGDTLVNTLILNSSWSVVHAIYGLRHENRSSEIYGEMSPPEILEQVDLTRSMLGDVRQNLGSTELPTLVRQIASRQRQRPLNLVIILEESLGATFVKSLGGVAVTPELEKLKSQGWWFEQLYATGTRSIRGIEAVLTGFPPTPAQSIVKLSLAQDGFYNLASLLASRGYATEFVYGGESHFDNMRGFFLSNGFQRVIDQGDFANPVFKGSWGVSDEDLFARAHASLQEHHASGKPFFSLVFTSSNHAPFEFPDGRIEPHDAEKATENNAVKYADHALSKFFAAAKSSAYWKDTVFLVVADHDIRVRGDSLVPIERFHIPGLILGADIAPRRVTSVTSQIDLAPTLLSLMGVDADHPMIGRDLSREPEHLPGRAMMQFEQHYGWMEGERVVVLRPQKPPAHARYRPADKTLSPVEPPADARELERRALAHVALPAWLYRERRYRLPEDAR